MRKAKLAAQVFPGINANENVVRVATFGRTGGDFNVLAEITTCNSVLVDVVETDYLSATVLMPSEGFDGASLVKVYFDDLEFIDE